MKRASVAYLVVALLGLCLGLEGVLVAAVDPPATSEDKSVAQAAEPSPKKDSVQTDTPQEKPNEAKTDQQDSEKAEKAQSEQAGESAARQFRIQIVQPGVIVVHSSEASTQKGSSDDATPKTGSRIVLGAEGVTGTNQIEIRVLENQDGKDQPGPSRKTISVQVVPGQPVKITVESDGKTWTVDETQLDQLPKDVRSAFERHRELIQQMLDRQQRLQQQQFLQQLTEKLKHQASTPKDGQQAMGGPGGPEMRFWYYGMPLTSDMARRLDRVEKELTELRKQMEALEQLTEEVRALRKALESKQN